MAKKILIGLLVFVLLSPLAAYFAVFHTSFPYWLVARALTKAGFETGKITGSLDSGIEIERLKAGGSQNSYLLENFKFKYSGWHKLKEGTLIIPELTIGKMHLKLSGSGSVTVNEGDRSQKRARGSSEEGMGYHETFLFKLFEVDKVSISDIEIDLPGLPEPIKIAACELRDIRSDRDARSSSMGAVRIRSNSFDLDANNSSVPGQKVITGELKPDFIPRLRKPLPFEGVVRTGGDRVEDLYVSALEKKMFLKSEANHSLVLGTQDLSLGEFVLDAPPLSKMNLRLSLEDMHHIDLTELKVEDGEFYVGPTKFTVVPGKFVHALGEKYRAYIEGRAEAAETGGETIFARLALSPKSGGYFALKLVPGHSMGNDDVLARVLFQKSFKALKKEQKLSVQQNADHFVFESL